SQTVPSQPLVQILKTSKPQELTNLNSHELTNSRTQNFDIPMVRVDGGIFMMGGCASEEFNTLEQNLFTHEESVRSFMISPFEVTQELWAAVMGNEVAGVRAKFPVDRVSWNECQTFIARLNAMTGRHYRLPTEREWEFAARGGIYSHGYRYAGSNFTDSVAWVAGYKTGGTLHPVATKCPNELGLYDMSGNAYEWCQDLMHGWKTEYDPINRYEGETEGKSDAQPSPNGDCHIMRGCSYSIIPREANHVAMRVYSQADSHIAGLRLAHDVEDSDSGLYDVMVKRGQTLVFTRVSPTEVALMSAIDRASLRGKLRVPQTVTIDGTRYTVVAIAASALQGCNELTAIHLPATLRYIGPMAFDDCPKLGRITVDSHNPVYTESMFKRSPEGNFLFKYY
ncbi:MAG: SUMF1/EgtB/PvdO family nonheme iron enzyme, partial [Bacteroidaceae bacterium]|nr:SUMF1/EgtB/PvdO family nonheme iron enzyme [Bacteroidaceae bacterium]